MKILERILLILILFVSSALHAQQTDSTSRSETVEREDFRFMLLPGIPPAENKVPVDFSLGLFGNESYGVKYLDFSTMVNKSEGSITGMQISGMINRVKGDVSGIEFSGLINSVSGQLQGFQCAGIYNAVSRVNMGMQVAGILNISRETSDVLQVAGVTNFALDTVKGGQIAGLCNIAEDRMQGVQIAGLNNVSKTQMHGAQISGLLNVANSITGSQLGFINVSDSICGVPVGFFSYAQNGYHKIEVAYSEVFPVNVSFQTGVNSFHNIFSAGILPTSDPQLLWYIGYGVGTALPMGKHLYLILDVTANQVSKGAITEKINLLNVGFLGVEFSPMKKFSIVTGPTLNAWMTKTNYSYKETIGPYIPHPFFDQTSQTEQLNTKMWIGWKLGVRLF